jgi:hypothetical protein
MRVLSIESIGYPIDSSLFGVRLRSLASVRSLFGVRLRSLASVRSLFGVRLRSLASVRSRSDTG